MFAKVGSDYKGAVAESAIAHAALKLGLGVSRPLAPERYDLVFDLRPGLVRVQCKWAVLGDDVVTIRCYSSTRGAGGLVQRAYEEDEVDAFAAYCAPLDRCFLVPMQSLAGQRNLQLRLAPARNNQSAGIRWADEFAFERLDWEALQSLGP